MKIRKTEGFPVTMEWSSILTTQEGIGRCAKQCHLVKQNTNKVLGFL